MCVPLSGRAYEADGGEWGVAWGDVRAAVGGRAAYEADGGEWGVAWGDVRAAVGAGPPLCVRNHTQTHIHIHTNK